MSTLAPSKPRISPTMQIMIGLVVGLLVGWYISTFDDATATYYANIIRPFSQIFIRMIRMLIAPLLFGTLVAGIAGAGHFKDVGRMGLRAIIYFEVVTTLALFIGLAAVNILKPGVGVVLPAEAGAPGVTAAAAQTWDQILLHLVPTSIIEAMATGDILQIVVFSIVFAIGLGMVGEKARPMIEWCESLTEAMFKVTNIVMLYAPIGVGAAIAYTIGVSGLQVLQNLAFMIFTLYVALAAFYLPGADPGDADVPHPDRRVLQGHQGAGADRVLDHVERSRPAAGDGMRRSVRRAAPHCLVHPAARLQLQPRRHDALPVAGVGVHRAGRRH